MKPNFILHPSSFIPRRDVVPNGTHVLSRRARPREAGIALVIVLGVLTVILLIAVAFALSARTEARSGATYGTLVQSKTLAKMGLDRCIMEEIYGLVSIPHSGNTNFYVAADLTQLPDGNAATDTVSPPFGTGYDYVDMNSNGQRDEGEPYWIAVTNSQGQMVGRFAYAVDSEEGGAGGGGSSGTGSTKVDINAIGNIRGAGQAYVRSNGYFGIYNVTAPTNYTRGIAGDVNLAAFLEKLGFTNPSLAAQRILEFRYGWPGYDDIPIPLITYVPGDPGDENGDGMTDDPTEFRYSPDSGAGSLQPDQAINDLTMQLVNDQIYADTEWTNLPTYATIASADNNLVNSANQTRINLNNTNISLAVDVGNVLSNVLLRALPSNDINQLTQWAVNIVDFHTTNRYPTVYTGGSGGTNTFIGIKRTPFVNQIRNGDIYPNPGVFFSGANAYLRWTGFNGVELWNPYGSLGTNYYNVIVTNNYSWHIVNGVNSASISTQIVYNVLLPPVATLPSGLSMSSSYPWNFTGAPGEPSAISGVTPLFSTNLLAGSGATISISNVVSYTLLGGFTSSTITNLIQRGTGILSAWTLSNVTTNWAGSTILLNGEADDPRVGYLWPQTNDVTWTGPNYYGLGTNSYVTVVNNSTYSPSPREGTNSFYFLGMSYVSIADIGYVYRGEPLYGSNAVGAWQTLRMQPSGEGAILDYVRINDMPEVRGRISLNSDTNGPLGGLQSPAFFALFKGITNYSLPSPVGLSDTAIEEIIADIGWYRMNVLSNASNPEGLFTSIGQLAEIPSLVTNTDWSIASTNDAAREYIIRSVANLLTTRGEAGVVVKAWGQTVKGKQPTSTIEIWALPGQSGQRITIDKFQYIRR